jgi:TetR/AcrR family transcriptional regulator
MPRPCKAMNDGDVPVRKRVLEAATCLFTQRGYAATTVREIVEAARVTKPSLYYYFGNKEGIYLEIVQEAADEMYRLVAQVAQFEGDARERILRFGREWHRRFSEHVDVARLIHSIFYGPPQGAPYFDYYLFHRRVELCLFDLVGQGIKRGEFRPPSLESMAWALMGAMAFVNDAQLIQCEQTARMAQEKELIAMMELIMAGAGAKPAAKRRRAKAGNKSQVKARGRK